MQIVNMQYIQHHNGIPLCLSVTCYCLLLCITSVVFESISDTIQVSNATNWLGFGIETRYSSRLSPILCNSSNTLDSLLRNKGLPLGSRFDCIGCSIVNQMLIMFGVLCILTVLPSATIPHRVIIVIRWTQTHDKITLYRYWWETLRVHIISEVYHTDWCSNSFQKTKITMRTYSWHRLRKLECMVFRYGRVAISPYTDYNSKTKILYLYIYY